MKKIIVSVTVAAMALMSAGCAKMAESGANDANKRYFDAWMKVNYPDAQAAGLGIYVIEDTPGTGPEVKKDGFALIDYVITDLEGNISSYTDKTTAEQMGSFDESYFYGAKFQTTADGTLPAGYSQGLVGMKVGGSRKFIIPGWLMSYSTYDTEEQYLENESSSSSAIYNITVKDYTDDIIGWQKVQIEKYFNDNSDIFENMTIRDTIPDHGGCWYKQTKAPTSDEKFSSDTTIYINYTGMLLNGLIFDTTDERTALDNGIWSASKTYEPVKITWGEAYTDITMGSGSSVIGGFALTLWQMKANESGIGVFTSEYGYGYSGSGSSIPPYSPLVFKIEIVEEPED